MRALFVSVIVLAGATISYGQGCAPKATEQAAQQALSLQRKLLAASVPTMDTDVPPALKPILHDFKQALVATVDTALRCNNPEPNRIQSDLAALLDANHPAKPFEAQPAPAPGQPEIDTGTYGGELQIRVKPVPAQANLVSIEITYAIECGEDNILLLYRRGPIGWSRELLYQNPDLNDVGDAIGDFFDWSLVQGPADQTLFAAVHGTPWCSSRISLLHVDLLSLARSGHPQATLAHLSQDYSRGDHEVDLKVRPDGFQFTADVNSLDFDNVFTHPEIFRFRTTSGKLDRVQPVARNARDFVDVWLSTPWPQSKWMTGSESDPLGSNRERTTDSTGVFEFSEVSFGPVRACSNDRAHFQVEVDFQQHKDYLSERPTPIGPRTSIYAQVRLSQNSCVMEAILAVPDPNCIGPDLMKPRQRRRQRSKGWFRSRICVQMPIEEPAARV